MRKVSEECYLLILSMNIKMIAETLSEYIANGTHDYCMLLSSKLETARYIDDVNLPLSIPFHLTVNKKRVGCFYYKIIPEQNGLSRLFTIEYSLKLEQAIEQCEGEIIEYIGYVFNNLSENKDIACEVVTCVK